MFSPKFTVKIVIFYWSKLSLPFKIGIDHITAVLQTVERKNDRSEIVF